MQTNKKLSQNSYDKLGSFALIRELQYSLYNIARNAELGDPELLKEIQKEADIALRLIDSYLATSLLESGQLSLNLTTIGIGSILHETAYEVRATSGHDVLVETKVAYPVMGHSILVKNFLFSIGYFMSKACSSELKFCSFESSDNRLAVAVVAKNFNISTKDLNRALKDGSAHMSMPKTSNQGAIMLLVADAIARALGSSLSVKKIGRQKGFGLYLPKSEQLTFI